VLQNKRICFLFHKTNEPFATREIDQTVRGHGLNVNPPLEDRKSDANPQLEKQENKKPLTCGDSPEENYGCEVARQVCRPTASKQENRNQKIGSTSHAIKGISVQSGISGDLHEFVSKQRLALRHWPR